MARGSLLFDTCEVFGSFDGVWSLVLVLTHVSSCNAMQWSCLDTHPHLYARMILCDAALVLCSVDDLHLLSPIQFGDVQVSLLSGASLLVPVPSTDAMRTGATNSCRKEQTMSQSSACMLRRLNPFVKFAWVLIEQEFMCGCSSSTTLASCSRCVTAGASWIS